MAQTVTINDDCWLLIVDLFYGDFQTLSRLMQVSRQLLAIAAPRLFAQLGDSENCKRVANWSNKKRTKLSILLLVSSGFFPHRMNQSQHNIGHCRLPLTIDYFNLLKKLPKELIGESVWKQLMGFGREDEWSAELFHLVVGLVDRSIEDGGFQDRARLIMAGPRVPNHQQYQLGVNRRHASVLTEIEMRSMTDVEGWLSVAHQLSQLTTLYLNFNGLQRPNFAPADLRSKLFQFVESHKTCFPGLLAMNGVQSRNEQHGELVMDLNSVLGPKRITLWLLPTMKTLEAKLANIQMVRNVEEIEMKYTVQIGDSQNSLQEDLQSLTMILQNCRRLKRIRVDAGSPLLGDGLLEWVKLERVQWDEYHSSNGSRYDDREQQQQQWPLIELEEFKGLDLSLNLASDIMQTFRSSIIRFEFRGQWENQGRPIGHNWYWPLSRLTSLKLQRCTFLFRKLEQCMVLQELILDKVDTPPPAAAVDATNFESKWRISTHMKHSLRSMKLVKGDAVKYLDFDSLGEAHRLEELVLDYDQFDIVPQRISPAVGWTQWCLFNLRRLTLGTNSCAMFWHRVLLKASPNLKMFSTPNSSMMMKDRWWGENQKQSLEHMIPNSNRQGRMDDGTTGEQSGNHPFGINNGDHDQEEMENWNVFETKIKSIQFGSFWTDEIAKQFSDLLEYPVLSLLLWSTSTIPDGISFPYLTHVIVSDVSRQPNSDHTSSTMAFEHLLMVLLQRPKMKWVDASCWRPTKQFEEEDLIQIDAESVPPNTSQYDGDDSDTDGRGVEFCILALTFVNGPTGGFYRLKNP